MAPERVLARVWIAAASASEPVTTFEVSATDVMARRSSRTLATETRSAGTTSKFDAMRPATSPYEELNWSPVRPSPDNSTLTSTVGIGWTV